MPTVKLSFSLRKPETRTSMNETSEELTTELYMRKDQRMRMFRVYVLEIAGHLLVPFFFHMSLKFRDQVCSTALNLLIIQRAKVGEKNNLHVFCTMIKEQKCSVNKKYEVVLLLHLNVDMLNEVITL